MSAQYLGIDEQTDSTLRHCLSKTFEKTGRVWVRPIFVLRFWKSEGLTQA